MSASKLCKIVDTGQIFKIQKATEKGRLPLWVSLMKMFILCINSLCDVTECVKFGAGKKKPGQNH